VVQRPSVAAASLFACVCTLVAPATAHSQSRGVYPLGMTAIGSGVTPEPGLTYANQLLFYSRNESKADDGSTLPVSGRNAVVMDMNSFVWVSNWELLGGAHYSAVATLPIARNQLVSDIHGQLSGGGGFADSYYLPLILGWNRERTSFRVLVGVLAPTGRFTEGASDNVGSGYWTPTLSSVKRSSSPTATRSPSPRSSCTNGMARSGELAPDPAIRSTWTTHSFERFRSRKVRRACKSALQGMNNVRRQRRSDRRSRKSNRGSGTLSTLSGSSRISSFRISG
jgi:Putative MetA-pathway of phenol degradation